jgi:hypothetical protein
VIPHSPFPHYPSTAELASFRRAILNGLPVVPGDHGFGTPAIGATFAEERARGIGFHEKDYPFFDVPSVGMAYDFVHTVSRKRAIAMRHTRYAAAEAL